MGHPAPNLAMTAADFLGWDAAQTIRHEFVGGEVFAMAGAGETQATVALNIAMVLRQHLRGTPCRTFISDMKLRVEAADAFFYPDVMVTCGAADAGSPLVKREALLVVEVLSPSTAGDDLGGKFASCRQLPSLREYLLVDPDARRCDLYRKGTDGLWVLHPADAGHAVTLASVDAVIPQMRCRKTPRRARCRPQPSRIPMARPARLERGDAPSRSSATDRAEERHGACAVA